MIRRLSALCGVAVLALSWTAASAITLALPPLKLSAAASPAALDATLAATGYRGVVIVDRSGYSRTTITRGISYGALPLFKPGAPWRWASVTKQVVAVLVMQEVEKGKIDLDAPAMRYLPGVTLAGGDAVTVRRLLNHTSGLFNPEDGAKDKDGIPRTYLRTSPPPAQGIDPQCLGGSDRVAGKDFSYNNCDFVVVGAVLEAVTGKPFAALINERIARPLRLRSLHVAAPGDRDGIVGIDANGVTDSQLDPGRFGPAANLVGTPADLIAFDRALLAGTLLGEKARAEMWAGDPKLGYAALGQWSYTVPVKGCAAPVTLIERRGEIGNVQVRNIVVPATGTAIVAFAATSAVDFGEPWQGKGLTYDLMRTALCEAAPK